MEIVKIKNKKAIGLAVAIIRNGGVVVCPTDTVYGFLADATNRKAVEKIYKIKERSKTKPLPIFIKDVKTAEGIAIVPPVAKKYWPGKYTLILNRKAANLYGVDKKTIALRIPKYKFLNILLRKINKPLVQTSVNISEKPALVKINDIVKEFADDNKVDLVIDAGSLSKNKPSTILDLTAREIKVLRK